MTPIAFCSSNSAKQTEFSRILGIELERVHVPLEEIQTLDTVAVCHLKAIDAFTKIGRPVVVDDTGFGLVALRGFPGALVTWAIDSSGSEILYRMLPKGASNAAIITTAIGFANEKGVEVFRGIVDGIVLETPRGHGGFGFDDVFVPNGYNRSLAEMTNEEKDVISPRSIALCAFKNFLHQRSS